MPAAGALSYEETELIKKVLGDKCSPLLSTVARLLMAPPDGSGWRNTKMAGALVLGVNREKNGAKFIRLYDMKMKEILFEQELYVGMVYTNPVPYFHMFEVDGAIIGLDFAVESEADNFHSKVNAMIPTSAGDSGSAALSETRKGGFMDMLGLGTRAPRDSVISRPTNVQHLQHIGYDPEKGFEVSNIPPEWKALFKSAGLKPKDLKNAETAAAIVATLENYEQEVGGAGSPLFASAPAAPAAPPAPAVGGAPPPPAPPKPGRAPPPPARGGAPPAPAAPPAPSAPPAPPAPSAPKAPPAPKGPPAAPKPGPPAPAGGDGGGRVDLLADIRKGRALKKVDKADDDAGSGPAAGRPGLAKKPSVGPRGGPAPGGGGDLADRLRAVMDARRLNIKHDEAEADGGDDDW